MPEQLKIYLFPTKILNVCLQAAKEDINPCQVQALHRN